MFCTFVIRGTPKTHPSEEKGRGGERGKERGGRRNEGRREGDEGRGREQGEGEE